jgi:hypothetical protein
MEDNNQMGLQEIQWGRGRIWLGIGKSGKVFESDNEYSSYINEGSVLTIGRTINFSKKALLHTVR